MNYTLNNGITIPKVGFGTWQIPGGEECYRAVSEALKSGYTHIDTAACYGNEESVGKAIQDSNLHRDNLFITTKLWNTDRGFEKALKAFEHSLDKLALDYVDLYLIHWPANKKQFNNWNEINQETWKALETLYNEGKVKAIGLSNFMPAHIQGVLDICKIKPAVNQIEFHPGYTQDKTVDFCRGKNILIEAWSPLGSGRVLEHPFLQEIATKYKTNVATLCLSFILQSGHIALPRSQNPINIRANLIKSPIQLSKEDFHSISSMENAGASGLHPDTVDF